MASCSVPYRAETGRRLAVTGAGMLFAVLLYSPADRAVGGTIASGDTRVTGTLRVIYGDDFARQRGERLIFVEDGQTGEFYRVHAAKTVPARLAAGRQVTLRGRVEGGQLYLAAGEETNLAAAGSTSTSGDLLATDAIVTGDQSTLVVVTNFTDASVACPVQTIRDTMFTDPNNKSIDDLYRETSLGQFSLSGQVIGPFRIAATSTDTCDVNAWASAADAAALAAGVDPAQYQKRVYVLPSQNTCGYTGLATIGGTPGKAWIMRCDLPGVYAHEIGHTLGMNHAATASNEYGDTSDFMGSELSGLRQLNAPHQHQMGWRAPERFVDVTQSGTYDVAPIELDGASATAPQALRIAKPDTGETYYVGYRQPIGFDANLSSQLTSRVQIHRYNGAGGRTWYLSGLPVGGQFVDSVNGITITNLALTPGYATVQVQFPAAGACAAGAPVVSATPSTQTVAPGGTANLAVTVTNTDSAGCAAAAFGLGTVVPSGWSASASPAVLSLAPGATGQATVSLVAPTAATSGTYTATVNVSDAAAIQHAASASVAVDVQTPCVRAVPAVTLSPAAQSGAPGQGLSYVASVSSRDGSSCPATTFAVAGGVPAGWTGTLSSSSVTLTPGQSAQVGLGVASSASAAAGVYGVAVSAANGSDSSLVASGSGTYQVVSTADVTAPTAPSGLTGRFDSRKSRISLSWTASADNVGVTAYRVYRDAAYLGQSATTVYSDAAIATGASYSYSVTAIDAAGNESAASAAVIVTTGSAKPKRTR
jgi:M6 family metalloprotease-like protein